MNGSLTNWLISIIGGLISLLIGLVGIMLRMHAVSDKERMDSMDERSRERGKLEDERAVHFRDRIHDALNHIAGQDNKIIKLETIIEARKKDRQ